MKILKDAQGSTGWFQARVGVVTASEASDLLTPEFKLRSGDTPNKYLCKKLGETKLGYSMDSLQMGAGTFAMDQGQIIEKLALPWFEFAYNLTAERVGLCVSDDGRVGASPDGLAKDFGVEIKSPLPEAHIGYLLDGVLPKKYAVQVHFSMYVTGLPLWYFISFHRYLPKLVIPVKRDEAIQAKIGEVMKEYFEIFDKSLKRINELETK